MEITPFNKFRERFDRMLDILSAINLALRGVTKVNFTNTSIAATQSGTWNVNATVTAVNTQVNTRVVLDVGPKVEAVINAAHSEQWTNRVGSV